MTGHERFCEKLNKSFEINAEKTAITFIDDGGAFSELSFSGLKKEINKRVETFKELGIKVGDRVAIIAPQDIDTCINVLALGYYNSTIVPLNIELNKDELLELVDVADVTCIITDENLFENKLAGCGIKMFDSKSLEMIQSGDFKHAGDSNADALAILFSSGTTNREKGVVVGFDGQVNQVEKLTQHFRIDKIIRERCLLVFPIYHISGFSYLIDLVINGTTIGLTNGKDINQILKAMHYFKPDTFGMIPKFWETVYELMKNKDDDDSKKGIFGGALKNIYAGAGLSNSDIMNQYSKMGFNVINTYASTEMNFVLQTALDSKGYKNTVSIRDDENVDVKIANANSDGVGELLVRTDTIMLGYFRDKELTEKAFEDGYFKTGDYAKMVNGEVQIIGRIKDSIHLSNGEKVAPTDAEDRYKSYLPNDIEYAVVAVPDETAKGYDAICLFIKAEAGQCDKNISEINKSVSRNYFVSNVEYVDELPKTSNGKIKRMKLKELFIKRHSDDKNDTLHPVNSLSRFVQYVRLAKMVGEDIDKYAAKYPLERTEQARKKYDEFMTWTEDNFDVVINGLNNFRKDTCYIFTPNHESHYDGMWAIMKLPENQRETIFTAAADYHFEGYIKDALYMMRAMPVDREGDATTSMLRAYELLLKGNNSLLIHPEGTRTRTGKLGEFHKGAAELSIYTGLQIVPIGIIGAREIYPPDSDKPFADLDESGNKRRLVINYGEPMNPLDYTDATEMTDELKRRITKLIEK